MAKSRTYARSTLYLEPTGLDDPHVVQVTKGVFAGYIFLALGIEPLFMETGGYEVKLRGVLLSTPPAHTLKYPNHAKRLGDCGVVREAVEVRRIWDLEAAMRTHLLGKKAHTLLREVLRERKLEMK